MCVSVSACLCTCVCLCVPMCLCHFGWISVGRVNGCMNGCLRIWTDCLGTGVCVCVCRSVRDCLETGVCVYVCVSVDLCVSLCYETRCGEGLL